MNDKLAVSRFTVLFYCIYWAANIATFAKLTFFSGYVYTWWNWIIVLPCNEFLALIWPIYWLIIRPVFGH